MRPQVAVVRCASYEPSLVYEKVKTAIGLLGGIEKFVPSGGCVLVKPNLLMAKPPEAGIDTHPEVVRAVIKVLKENLCKIYVGDGPSVWGAQAENVDNVYEQTGIKRVCREEDVTLVRFDKRRWRGKFPLTTWIDECQYLVSVPKFKTHELTLLTGAVKNLYGLVSGTYKTELHKKYFKPKEFSKIVVDIYEQKKPALSVVDGIVAMEGDGPGTSGSLRQLGLIISGQDGVAVDSVLAQLMGIRPQEVLTNKEAGARGLGECDLNNIEIVGEKPADLGIKPFLLPAASLRSRIPQPIVNFIKRFIKYRPIIQHQDCSSCGVCIETCPNQLIRRKNGRIIIDYSRCIYCFCCQEACPNSAIKVRKSLLAKLTGL
ncbi:MAG: DUF362 domain-containing protein [Candidatus Omnitrophica bacterium]|nr:DUF362 domain-containing protein [Candidatus Omnitrophota bacterium]